MVGRAPLASAAVAAAAVTATAALGRPATLVPFRIVDGAIADRLTPPEHPARGRALALDRSKDNRVTCHAMPVDADVEGDLGPPLDRVGGRWTAGEIRLRIVDGEQVNPVGHLPSDGRREGLNAVRRDRAGRTLLAAQEVENILACPLTPR
jgi:sulfur-oxidizing protein SoxX